MQRAFFFLSAALVCAAAISYAQEQPDPLTLIPSSTLNAIAQHVSGAQAHNHVLEMCPYERNRPAEEYQGTYRESAYAEARAKESGFSDVRRSNDQKKPRRARRTQRRTHWIPCTRC